MGILRWFGQRNSPETLIKKHALKVANKRAYAPDRWDSIQTLAAMKSEAAVAALLPRFLFTADPSITDQEEKDLVYRSVVELGPIAVPALRQALDRDPHVAWLLKCLESILDADALCQEVLAVLAKMQAEYERNPQKKLQLILALQAHQHGEIVTALARFLDDPNETVRFSTVETMVPQANCDTIQSQLVALFLKEESLRIRTKLAELFATKAWKLKEHSKALREMLPETFAIDTKTGSVMRAK